MAGGGWPKERRLYDILKALANLQDAVYLYLAGMEWADDYFDDSVVQALVESGSAYALYLAGKDWPTKRYSPLVGEVSCAYRLIKLGAPCRAKNT